MLRYSTCLIYEGFEELFDYLSSEEARFLNILNGFIIHVWCKIHWLLDKSMVRMCLSSIEWVLTEGNQRRELVTSYVCCSHVHTPMNSWEFV